MTEKGIIEFVVSAIGVVASAVVIGMMATPVWMWVAFAVLIYLGRT